jgi:hypothetical protein
MSPDVKIREGRSPRSAEAAVAEKTLPGKKASFKGQWIAQIQTRWKGSVQRLYFREGESIPRRRRSD